MLAATRPAPDHSKPQRLGRSPQETSSKTFSLRVILGVIRFATGANNSERPQTLANSGKGLSLPRQRMVLMRWDQDGHQDVHIEQADHY